MARNRVIYQSEALYVSKDANSTTDHKQLERVQSANYSFSFNRTDVNQYGQLAKVDTIQLEPPTVNLDFSYYLTDGFNERALGFFVQTGAAASGGFMSGHLADGSGRNFYILTVPEGTDAKGTTVGTATNSAIGVGNAYLTDYTVDLAVGSIPTASVSYEALNIRTTTGATISSAAINPVNGDAISSTITLPTAITGNSAISVIRPGDITLNITNFTGKTLANLTSGADGIHIQNASLSIPMSRSSLQRLGSRNAYARSTDFPVVSTLSVSAIVNEVAASNLANILDDEEEKDITITMKDSDGTNRIIWTLKGCSLVSESFSSSIGSNKTVDLSFQTSISGPSDTTNGILVSGANITAAF